MADEANTRHRFFRLDAYTIIIIALIPSFMLIAAGATWFYERAEAKRACENTTSYLASASELLPSFQNAGTLSGAGAWLTGMESLSPPEVANDLHDAATGAVEFGMTARPEIGTTEPGAVYDAITPFQNSLDTAREELVRQCPEVAPQIPETFPMFFTEDNQQP